MKTKIITITIDILTLIHLFIGMWWISALLLIIPGGYFLATSKNKYIAAFRKKIFLFYPLSLTGIFLLAIVLRVFIFGFFIVPTNSMERTIMPGDVI